MDSSNIIKFIKLLRPHQWIKNVVVFVGIIFAKHFYNVDDWILAALCAGAFCLISSACYIMNDFKDIKQDQMHPIKKNRPLASGSVSKPSAILLMIALTTASLGTAWHVGQNVFFVIAGYGLLQILYTFILKHQVIIDVICIATGFVLRAIAGALAIDVRISPWLIICVFCLCLFLGFCKRFCEIRTMSERQSSSHRKNLIEYKPDFLVHLITISATIAVIAFLVYSTHAETIARFGTIGLAYTLPLVIYCICRASMLSMAGAYSDPTTMIISDRPLQIAAVIWWLVVVALITLNSTQGN